MQLEVTTPNPQVFVFTKSKGTAYTSGDPINSNDPQGLVACGDLVVSAGVFGGRTIRQVMTGTTGNDLLAQLVWHEGGTIYNSDLSSRSVTSLYIQDLTAIGTAVLNQWDIDNHRLTVYQNGKAVCPLGQCLGRTLETLIETIATHYDKAGNLIQVFDHQGHMIDASAAALKLILNADIGTSP